MHADHLPAGAFVLGDLRRGADRFNVVGQIPELVVVQDEVIRRHRRAVVTGHERAENLPWRRAALEWPPSQVGRLDLEVLGRGPVAAAFGAVAFVTLRLGVGLAPARDRCGCGWSLRW